MKKLLTAVLLSFSVLTLSAQKLTLDPAHSQILFDVSHMTISEVSGSFHKFEIDINHTNEDFTDAKFNVLVNLGSIDTGIEARDNHLKSADFFNTDKYPNMVFNTTSVEKVKTDRKNKDRNLYKLTGNLTINGVTKTVTFDAEYKGSVAGQEGKKVYGFIILGEVKRSDFNIGTKFPETLIGDVVNLKASLEFKEN